MKLTEPAKTSLIDYIKLCTIIKLWSRLACTCAGGTLPATVNQNLLNLLKLLSKILFSGNGFN